MNELVAPRPNLPGIYTQNPNSLLPQIRYWITSLGKVHRPGCSFYKEEGELFQAHRKGWIVGFAVVEMVSKLAHQ